MRDSHILGIAALVKWTLCFYFSPSALMGIKTLKRLLSCRDIIQNRKQRDKACRFDH